MQDLKHDIEDSASISKSENIEIYPESLLGLIEDAINERNHTMKNTIHKFENQARSNSLKRQLDSITELINGVLGQIDSERKKNRLEKTMSEKKDKMGTLYH